REAAVPTMRAPEPPPHRAGARIRARRWRHAHGTLSGPTSARRRRTGYRSRTGGEGGALAGAGVAASAARSRGRTLRWRPQVRVGGIVSGLLFGLGVSVLAQQYGASVFDTASLLRGAVGGVVSGIVIPSIAAAFAVAHYNRKLSRARLAGGAAVVML